MKKSIYTILLDYNGRTYIKQVSAKSPLQAILLASVQWAEAKPADSIRGLSSMSWRGVFWTMKEGGNDPVPVHTMRNVWYASVTIRGKLAGFNIVQTQG